MESTHSTTGCAPRRGLRHLLALLPGVGKCQRALLALSLSWLHGGWPAAAQPATMQQISVLVSALVRNSPTPQIRLTWSSPVPNGQAATFTVWRRAQGATSWGTALFTSTTAITSYDDNAVTVGMPYEYRVRRNSTAYSFEGYVLSGIDVPAIESRGTLVLVVDNTFATALTPELTRLRSDLIGDGWQVVRHDVAPTLPVPQVKAIIKADYLAAPTDVKAVFLLGHIAVPYSGNQAIDGHPDHQGAWPADVYYGDMMGAWTDTQVNTSTAYRPANRNIPGDGKFDQDGPPGVVNIQVGRVDMDSLTFSAFFQTETDLLRRYLSKDHDFRHKVFTANERGLVEDNFLATTGNGMANTGWANFSALVGEANVLGGASGTYFNTLRVQSYLLGYACGGGNFFGANRVGDVRQFGINQIYSVFNMLGGSYFGDWDNRNNFLRGAIGGAGHTLTNCWGEVPWSYHLMGLGQTVGYATIQSQNGGTSGSRMGIYAALMGDPSLRLHPLAPPTAPTATASSGQAALAWVASAEPVLGYYLYRAASPAGPFVRITAQPVSSLTYTDAAPLPGTATYMVRAVALKTSSSGSYYNLSQGAFVPFTAPAPIIADGTWTGTVSTAWANPANWDSSQVPTSLDEATIAANVPFAPLVAATQAVRALTLLPGAMLTVGSGGSLSVAESPAVQGGSATSPTRVVLAAATPLLAGGQLTVLDQATPAGLVLTAGTALLVDDGAELVLSGHFTHAGGTATFGPLGRLVFAHPAGAPAGFAHGLAGPATTTVGVLTLLGAGDNLTLSAPVQVLGRVENPGTIVTNNNLTLLSTRGQQAILAPVVPFAGQPLTLGTYTGNVTVQVYVDGTRNAGLGYHHLSSPLGGTTVSSLTTAGFSPVVNPLYNTQGSAVRPFPTVFSYAQTRVGAGGVPGPVGFAQGWASPASLTTPLATGHGYTVNMAGNATLNFTGPAFTNSNFAVNPIEANTSPEAGWQLFGNPHAAPINWDGIADGSPQLLSLNPALYVFKSSGTYGGSYASYLPGTGGNPGVGVNGGSPVIPVGQGFFVRKNSIAVVGVLIRYFLDDLITTPVATTVQRSTADTRPRLILALTNAAGTLAHETAIYFQAGATTGPDAAYDAPYLAGPGQALALTTELGGTQYAINGLPALTGTDVLLPLQLSAATAGPYRLAVQTLAALPPGYHAYLRDTQTGTLTDLAATLALAVILPANIPVRRYAMLFSTQSQALAIATQSLNHSVTLSPNPAHGTATLTLPLAGRSGQPTAVQVYNALGQRVLTRPLPATAETLELPLSGLPPGVYLVRAGLAMGRLVVE